MESQNFKGLFLFAVITVVTAASLSCQHPQKSQVILSQRSLTSVLDEGREDIQTKVAPDPKKKTVCTLTLNSENEREKFKKHLPEFNFVELAVGSGSGWLEASCNPNVQCDILVFSGHFGGSFFGKSNLKLPMDEMEHLACQSKCDGIFKRPKEVYLFGCNTLAGKDKDRRTPEEYIRVLRADGFSLEVAQQVAAFRYSPIGSEFKDRMRKVFSNPDTKLYGFSSIGPAGGTAEKYLERYFKAVKKQNKTYEDHLSKNPTCSDQGKDLFKTAFKLSAVAKACGNEGSSPVCVLGGKQSINQKLSWIDGILQDPVKRLAYTPNINAYLKRVDEKFLGTWPEAERSYFEKLQFNKVAKSEVLKTVAQSVPGLVAAQISVVNFAEGIGWVNAEEYLRLVRNLIGDVLNKNISEENKNLLCSYGAIEITRDSLPIEKWNELTIEAIGCMAPSDPKIHEALAQSLLDPNLKVRKASALALGKTKSESEKIHNLLLDRLVSLESEIQFEAAQALIEMPIKDLKMHEQMFALLNHELPMLRVQAIRILGAWRTKDPRAQSEMLRKLEDPSESVRYAAGEMLGRMKPSESLQFSIVRLLNSSEENSKVAAIRCLSFIKPTNEKLRSQIASALGDSRFRVRLWATLALINMKLSPEIMNEIRKLPGTVEPAILDDVRVRIATIEENQKTL